MNVIEFLIEKGADLECTKKIDGERQLCKFDVLQVLGSMKDKQLKERLFKLCLAHGYDPRLASSDEEHDYAYKKEGWTSKAQRYHIFTLIADAKSSGDE